MNMKLIEEVAKNTDKKWYVSQAELSVILGCDRRIVADFLKKQSVPFYGIGKQKRYFLPEALEAAEKTKWKAG